MIEEFQTLNPVESEGSLKLTESIQQINDKLENGRTDIEALKLNVAQLTVLTKQLNKRLIDQQLSVASPEQIITFLGGLTGEERAPLLIAHDSLGNTLGHLIFSFHSHSPYEFSVVIKLVNLYFDFIKDLSLNDQAAIFTSENYCGEKIGDLIARHTGHQVLTIYLACVKDFPEDVQQTILSGIGCELRSRVHLPKLKACINHLKNLPHQMQAAILTVPINAIGNDLANSSNLQEFNAFLNLSKDLPPETQTMILTLPDCYSRVSEQYFRSVYRYRNEFNTFLNLLKDLPKLVQTTILTLQGSFIGKTLVYPGDRYSLYDSLNAFLNFLKDFPAQTKKTILIHIGDAISKKNDAQIICNYLVCLDEIPSPVTFPKNKRQAVVDYIKNIKDTNEQLELQRIVRTPESALHQFLSSGVFSYFFPNDNTYVRQITTLKIEPVIGASSNHADTVRQVDSVASQEEGMSTLIFPQDQKKKSETDSSQPLLKNTDRDGMRNR